MTETILIRWDGALRSVPRRDAQRQRAYDAERAAFGGKFYARDNADAFRTFAQAVRYVRRVERSATWRKMLALTDRPHAPLEVRKGASHWQARGGSRGITLPEWSWTVPIILHEMAHAAVPPALHNWPWAQVYLRLVRRFVGAESHDRLRAAFKEHGVKFRVGQRACTTPEPDVQVNLARFFTR